MPEPGTERALTNDGGRSQVAQPFDGGKFNFNKALQREVLFQFEPAAEASFDPMVPVTESPNLVYINVSPIEYGHVLLVPRVLDCLPQARLADASLSSDTLCLSLPPCFMVLGNSGCAPPEQSPF